MKTASKRLLLALSFVLCLISTLVVPVSQASAASDYDDFFPAQSTTTLINHVENYYGKSCGSSTNDYAATWSSAMHTNNVYSADPTHGLEMTSFDNAVSSGNGGWAVTYNQVNNGDNTSNPYFINVYWTEDASQWEQIFYSNPSGTDHYFALKRKDGVSSSVKLHNAYVGSSELVQGTGGCGVEWLFGEQSDGFSFMKGWSTKLFLSTFDTVDPSGYAGPPVPSTYTPPTPAKTLYNGTVDCTNDSLEYMMITQDGVTHPVPLSNFESIYRAHWSYELTESPYVIQVGCGDKMAASFRTDITPMPPTSNDWMCDSTSNPAYCILS